MDVEFIPVTWLERAAWAAGCGERLVVYSRSVAVERRWGERRIEQRPGCGRRVNDPVVLFESLNPAELALA